jgi:CDP-glucose 4,6-dehydratase
MDSSDIHGEAFNFSNEQPISVNNLVTKILKLMDREDLSCVVLNQASNEIKHQYLSSEKARTNLDWKPRYTLDEGLKETIRWYEAYFKENLQV